MIARAFKRLSIRGGRAVKIPAKLTTRVAITGNSVENGARRDNCRFIAAERRSLTTCLARHGSMRRSFLLRKCHLCARARGLTHDASFGRVSNIERARARARRVSNLPTRRSAADFLS